MNWCDDDDEMMMIVKNFSGFIPLCTKKKKLFFSHGTGHTVHTIYIFLTRDFGNYRRESSG